MSKSTEDLETNGVLDKKEGDIKDVIAEEQISKLDDDNHRKNKKNKKLKDKVKTRDIVILGLIIIIIILLLRSCSGSPKMDITPEIERQVWQIPDGYDETDHEDGVVSIMGWNDDKTISKSNPALLLKNPSANIGYYYLQFKVTEDDKVLYESKLVTAGNMIAADFPKDLSIGEHNVVVSVTAYGVDNKAKAVCAGDISLKIIMTE